MKKLITIAMALVMVVMMAACGNKVDKPGVSSSVAPSGGTSASNGMVGTAATKTGLGTVISLSNSTSANTEKDGTAQADVTMCAATFEEDGTIVSVSIDVAQCRISFDETGTLTTDIDDQVKTKKEQRDAYNMKGNSDIGKEWYEQIASLEEWMTGKTVDEVKGMSVVEKDADHPAVPDEADLKTSVTISVDGYLKALEAAYNNAH